jgi:hypothetical protein
MVPPPAWPKLAPLPAPSATTKFCQFSASLHLPPESAIQVPLPGSGSGRAATSSEGRLSNPAAVAVTM